MPRIDIKSFVIGVLFALFLLPLVMRLLGTGREKLTRKR